jgi:hypothetical protein
VSCICSVLCCIWRVALCGAENWTLRKLDQVYLESLNCGAGGVWRSAGPVMSEMEYCYIESGNGGISYMK